MEQEIYQVCQKCNGSGDFKKKDCQDCDGTGRVLFGFLVTKEVELKKESEPKKDEYKTKKA